MKKILTFLGFAFIMSCSKENVENQSPSAQHDGPRWRTYFEYWN
ncbi:hypothetical protein [Thermaurantimonas aggregans]|nr:hypothetical protein [Thermaurantimonas aggregans]MCX8149370.1 hypothetical protein [Thermaurantimonas aggregans]